MDQYINRKSVLKFKASLKKTFNSKTSKLQGFIVLFYILVVFVGLVSRLDETYYQSKNNVFNKIFAKNGWFWNTVVYGAYLAINENERQGEKLVFSILRYIVATGYWYIITQKTFFGPSVFDMIFTMSGGNCRFNEDTESFSNYGKTNDINSSYQCKQLKGEWINGHDASGHCFLLVHSSLFLLEEICGSFNKKKILELNKFNFFKKIFFGLLILWVNMLFFTVTYFHNMKESSTGLIFGILYWFLIYFLLLPKLQKLFNVPLLPYEIEHENNDIKNENENENENESESESESDKEEKKWEFRKERGIWLNIYYYTLNIGYHTLDLIIKAGILFSERISMLIY